MGDSVGGVATKKGLRRLVELFEEHKPDVFLWWAMYGQGDGDKRQLEGVKRTIAECRSIAPKCLFCYGNGNQASVLKDKKPDWNVDAYSQWIDVVLDTTDDVGVAKIYRDCGYGHEKLHTFGFDPDTFPDYTRAPAEYDAYFGGSFTGTNRFPNSGFRSRLITAIDKEFNLLVTGRGKWHVKNRGNYRNADEYIKSFGEGKVALGCYHGDLNRYYTKRTVYALASGRPYLVRYIPGMENDFEYGKHLLWYQTVGDCVNKLRTLVRDPGLRMRIGDGGRAVAVENHSWAARLSDFGTLIRRLLA